MEKKTKTSNKKSEKKARKYYSVTEYSHDFTKSFEESPLNEVDMALFSLISYYNFEPYVEKYHPLFIKDLDDKDLLDPLLERPALSVDDLPIVMGISHNPRFKDVRIRNYEVIDDPSKEEQFTAVTFVLKDGTIVIAYRGTDSSLHGWKEDFNMAYMYPIPSQIDASKYTNRECAKATHDVYLTGHSKGGNLALYSFLHLTQRGKKRVKGVYLQDSPSLEHHPGVHSTKIHKIVPFHSIIGMMFEKGHHYEVVASEEGMMHQHVIYRWHVEGDHFKRVDAVSKRVQRFNKGINRWVLSSPPEEREMFIETGYEILLAAGASNSIEIVEYTFKDIRRIFKLYKNLDADRKKQFKKNVGNLLRNLITGGD